MIINGVAIEDTFAEAFGMRATRLIITADTAGMGGAPPPRSLTGFATSVIGCGCEAGSNASWRAERDAGRTAWGRRPDLRHQFGKELQKQLQPASGNAC